MILPQALHEILRCPECNDGRLKEASPLRIDCTQCQAQFPVSRKVPWLLKTPKVWQSLWNQQHRAQMRDIDDRIDALKYELSSTTLLKSTHDRLKILRSALIEHKKLLAHCLTDFVAPAESGNEIDVSTQASIAAHQSLLGYAPNVFRDWVWGEREIQKSVELLRACSTSAELGRVLLLGAGAGRLAFEVHNSFDTQLTLAIDINPYLCAIASAMSSGRELSLYEFPLLAKSAADVAVLQTLKQPRELRNPENFAVLIADGVQPPFAEKSFDTVITPWFVDVVPQNFAATAHTLNDLLKDGGQWIQQGPLGFSHAKESRQFLKEELFEMLCLAGFETEKSSQEDVEYLRSPHAAQSRIENVLCFGARKAAHKARPQAAQKWPDWMSNETLPVPFTRDFQTVATLHKVYSTITQLIDGNRSLADIANIAAPYLGVSLTESLESVKGFVGKLWNESELRRFR